MFAKKAFARGDAFQAELGGYERPLFMLAHHDDEVSMAGLMQRLQGETRVVWMTNSDGLYFESDLRPKDYGELRKREGLASVARIGIPPERALCLDFSEVEIYRRMAALYDGSARVADVHRFFTEIRRAMRATLFDAAPDIVFTQAWQGGQPEHDLTHYFTRRALDDYERETGRRVPFFHVPAYEYTIVLAQRFHPLYEGERLRIRLTDDELATKLEMIESYPSQVRLFGDFRKVFHWIGKVPWLVGGARSIEEFLRIEELGPVPATLDYTKKPHVHDFFTYMFDDFEGTPVTFSRSVLPIVRTFMNPSRVLEPR